jgi:hypothetical protein
MTDSGGQRGKGGLLARIWRWLRTTPSEPKDDSGEGRAEDAAGGASGKVTLTAGGATLTAELGPAEGGGKADKQGDSGGGGALGSGILKVAGTAAAGIAATGFITVVGAAVFWTRFHELGLPVTQALSAMPRSELLVQGAQETIVFLAIALVAVLLVYFADEEGRVTGVTQFVLLLLGVGAVGYLFTTDLAVWVGIALAALAILLLLGCVQIGRSTQTLFWPLALAVFTAALVYSSAVGLLVVKHQRYAQAVAVLRGANDSGMTGIYITATEKTIYLGSPIATKDADRRAMLDVKRGDEVTYAVGPLESVDDADVRAKGLLEKLLSNRDAAKGATAPAPAPTPPSGGVGAELPDWVEGKIAAAFVAPIHVHEKTEKEPLCLARYAEAGGEAKGGHWWTSCAEAIRLRTVLDAKDALALPARFQAVYDERILAKVPAEEDIVYLEGPVAPQCEHSGGSDCGYEYKGGGLQLYLPNPAKAEITAEECTVARPDESSRWVPCAKK